MNIILSVSSTNQFCGAFQNVYNIGRGLADRGHKVTVLSVGDGPESTFVSRQLPEGPEVCIFKGYRVMGKVLPFAIVPFCIKFLRQTDVIFLNGHRNFLSLVISIFANLYKIPYVVVPQSTLPASLSRSRRQKLVKKIYDSVIGRRIIKKAACVGAISDREVKDILDYGVGLSSIDRWYTSVDIQTLTNTESPNHFRRKFNISDKYLIVYLGRIDPFKGIDCLVKAFSMLDNRGSCSLIIAGPDDGFKQELTSLVDTLGISKEVYFMGPLVGSEKKMLYKDADVVFYAGLFESFGLVAFEALYSGTPVIVSRNTDCGEMIGKADAGYLVDYGNVSELKNTIEYVRAHPSESCQKVQNGKELIRDVLSIDKVAVELESVLKKAIEVSRITDRRPGCTGLA